MRGVERGELSMFSYVSLEDRVPKDHPLRLVKLLVDAALERMSPRFEALYGEGGRESIPPEQLLRALLLQILYTIRSERQLVEQLDYNLLFRWFVGLGVDDTVWNHSSFSKNRDRLMEGEIADAFFLEVLSEAKERDFLSSEHFTVDGTLVQAWAGQKSFKKDPTKTGKDDDDLPQVPKHRRKFLSPLDPRRHPEKNPEVNFHGEKRSNTTHSSTTDPEAVLAKKGGGEAKLSYCGHLVTENRNGLVMVAELSTAHGTAERDMVSIMVDQIPFRRKKITLGADKGYDVPGCVNEMREHGATPHVASKKSQGAIDARTSRHDGYAVSQQKRKLVEECYGWLKTIGPMRQTKFRGELAVRWMFILSAAAYNLVRIRNLSLAQSA